MFDEKIRFLFYIKFENEFNLLRDLFFIMVDIFYNGEL